MALKQILLTAKIAELEKQREELNSESESINQRRASWMERERRAEEAFSEITEETPEEERNAFDAEAAAVEAEDGEIKAEEDRIRSRMNEIEEQIRSSKSDLDELNKRQSEPPKGNEKNNTGDETKMERREFLGMSREEQNRFITREEVKKFLNDVRSIANGIQTRGVSNAQILVPEVFVGLIRDSIDKNSKLIKHVNKKNVAGKARTIVSGDVPEAVWTEMCATLNELEMKFNDFEVDGYKVGGYIPICNSTLNDSDINLAFEIIDGLGQAIGYAVDKAIVYGAGTKMPLGFVTRLAQTSKPEDYPATEREWVNLSESNIVTIASQTTAAKLFSEIVKASGKAKNKNGNGKFWVMNDVTYNEILAQAITMNSAGAIVTGMQKEMPIVGGMIEILDFIPDNNIGFGYGSKYMLAEREGTTIGSSEHVRFLQDQTVYKGTARYDGGPVIAESFVIMGINGTAPTKSIDFAADSAN